MFPRHCERSEAIQLLPRRDRKAGLLRRYAPRNDGGGRFGPRSAAGATIRGRMRMNGGTRKGSNLGPLRCEESELSPQVFHNMGWLYFEWLQVSAPRMSDAHV